MSRNRHHGTAAIARVIDGQAKKRAKRNPVVDLGTILSGGRLQLDHFTRPIPAADLLIDERFTGGLTRTRAGGAGEAQYASHDHEQAPALQTGDRVLVILLDADSDAPTPYIIGRL